LKDELIYIKIKEVAFVETQPCLHGPNTPKKAWTGIATLSLGVLRKPRMQIWKAAHAYSAGTALQFFALLFEKFLSSQRE
jgi:hypothetical protein